MTITREQIKEKFVSKIEDIGEYAYNNEDWYKSDAPRMRYLLATMDLGKEPEVQLELGYEDNRFYNCIEFDYEGGYKIKVDWLLEELMSWSEDQLRDYIEDNEYDWLGDDYDHIQSYLNIMMNEWQEEVEYDTEDYENPDRMTITTRKRDWKIDPETGYKSENRYEVAYKILMEYWESLPDDEKESINKRLNAVSC